MAKEQTPYNVLVVREQVPLVRLKDMHMSDGLTLCSTPLHNMRETSDAPTCFTCLNLQVKFHNDCPMKRMK
jgi:hypothetical protein